jgi:hypothetical protein
MANFLVSEGTTAFFAACLILGRPLMATVSAHDDDRRAFRWLLYFAISSITSLPWILLTPSWIPFRMELAILVSFLLGFGDAQGAVTVYRRYLLPQIDRALERLRVLFEYASTTDIDAMLTSLESFLSKCNVSLVYLPNVLFDSVESQHEREDREGEAEGEEVGGDEVGGDEVGGEEVGGEEVGGDEVGGEEVGGEESNTGGVYKGSDAYDSGSSVELVASIQERVWVP